MKTLHKKSSTIPGTYQGQFIRFLLKKPISQPRSQVPLLFALYRSGRRVGEDPGSEVAHFQQLFICQLKMEYALKTGAN